MVVFDEEFEQIHKRMEKILRDFFPDRFMQMPGETWRPPMDIYETEEDLLIVIELAGVIPESLKISFEMGRLKINGRREFLADFYHIKCHQIEIDSGSFQKQIHIPFEVDKDHTTSHYRNGLLRITLPKAKRPRKKKVDIVRKKLTSS